MQGVECIGPVKCAEVVCKYFPENREYVVVFDVGTGTGLAAEEVCYTYISFENKIYTNENRHHLNFVDRLI